jgi:hypothetical protein
MIEKDLVGLEKEDGKALEAFLVGANADRGHTADLRTGILKAEVQALTPQPIP